MKKKMLSLLLIAAMTLSPLSVSAAEFYDGADMEGAVETFSAGPEADDVFAADAAVEEMPGMIDMSNLPVLSAQSTYQISVTGELINSETQKFLDMVNAERAKLGRSPLELDQQMMDIAAMRAIQGSVAWGHILPNGNQVNTIYNGLHENASGKFEGTAEAFFEGWKHSNPHWTTLMDTKTTRFGFAIYHHKDVNNYYYGYTESATDAHILGHTLIPYTGGFANKPVNSFKIDVIPFYLDMKSLTTSVNLNDTLLLKPEFKAHDTAHNGGWDNMGYEFGSGALDNDNGYWESSEPSIVSVDSNGNAKALKEGTATIRFYVNGDRDKYYQNVITVVNYGGWDKEDGKIYYLDSEGNRVYGWKTIDGKLYHFVGYLWQAEYGAATNGKKVDAFDGMIHDMTLPIDGVWYSFDSNGVATKLNGKPSTPTPPSTPAPAPIAKPKTPTLKGNPAKYTNAVLTWTKPSNAKGYQIYVYDAKTKKYVRLKTITSANILTYTQNVGYGKTCIYKVRAYNTGADGQRVYGSFSKGVTIKTPATAPRITSINNKYKNTLVVNWKKVSAAEGYQVYRSTSKNGTYKRVYTTGKNTIVSYKNTGLKKGNTYYYKIRSFVTSNGKRYYGKFSAVKYQKCK